MKDAEDEAFDELAKRQGHWGGGYQAKKAMAADKLRDCMHGSLARSCQICDLEAEVEELKAALAQPTQEPVAWAIYDKRGGSKSLHWSENHSPDGDATKFDAVPLYTAPPQRPWVGLTEEDFSAINQSCLTKLQAATSAESILKRKNI
jgi:hypothetical protein